MRSAPRHPAAATTPRSGFTLLELLISLGLALLLIASVGATIMIFLRTETAGRQRMQRAQIVRSIYLRMAEDLRDTTYVEQITSQSADSGMSAAEETEQSDIESELGLPTDLAEFRSPAEAIGATTNGLYGDSNSLVIYIKRPQRLPPRIASQASAEDEFSLESINGSGLRCVSWYQNGLSSVGGMVTSMMPATEDTASFEENNGLCRLDHDAVDLQSGEDVFDLLSYDARVLAPEVIEVQFRYFDGVEWVEEWDSTAQERLPGAVEVTLTFEEVELTRNELVLGADPDGLAANTFRFVIALPMAPPPLTEIQL